MDADRINSVLGLHGGAIAWKSHLAAVELLCSWSLDDIIDFQRTLIESIASGSYVVDSTEPVLELSSGTVVNAEQAPMWRMVKRSMIADGIDIERNERDLAELAGWSALPTDRAAIPFGLVGLPLPWMPRAAIDLAREEGGEAAVIRLLKSWAKSGETGYESANLLFREAPWAYRRITGAPPKGDEYSYREELHDAGGERWFSISTVAERGTERVEVICARISPSTEFAVQAQPKLLRGLFRSIGARPVSSTAVALEGEAVAWSGWAFEDGQILAETLGGISSEATALGDDLARVLFAGASDPKSHPRMNDDEFWHIIEPVGTDFGEADIEELTRRLAWKGQKKIVGFAETLADKLFELDRPELASPPESSAASIMSADVFLYFRAAVVLAGRTAFDRVIDEGGIREEEWRGELGELLLSVAPDAWELRVGRDFDHETARNYETGSNSEAWGEPTLAVSGAIGHSVISGAQKPDGSVIEVIRFWKTPDEHAARAAHDEAESARFRSGYGGILSSVPIPNPATLSDSLTLARIGYYRSVR